MWPFVQKALDYVQQFDQDGDGMIENEGFPDQTYDNWTAKGPSAYTGGLWVACLKVAARMADIIGDAETMRRLEAQMADAQAVYETLYNGDYFDYDASGRRSATSIMADQLAGHWYTQASHLTGIVNDEIARRALQTVHEYNVQLFEGGEIGAVNGMRPDGAVDTVSLQAAEVWTGVTYAVAAAMLQAGLTDEAWETAKGITTGVERFGYWFQTPEAWTHTGAHRSLGYMRPLSIWAIQWAWQNR
jgi:non-lysosomal glucosylceramidase